MKKVLLIIIASLFSFSSANALEYTIGAGFNVGVFAAEGKEDNCNEDCSEIVTTKEYGAFQADYGSVFVEVGNGALALGLSYAETISTPMNTNQPGGDGDSTSTLTSQVSADFENYVQLYLLGRLPIDGILGGLYGKVGMTEVDIIVNETMKSGTTYPDQETSGIVVALGYDKEISEGLGLRLEIAGHELDSVTADNGVAATGNRNVVTISDMIGATATLSVAKTF